VLYIVHFTAFCLGGAFFSGHGVFNQTWHQHANTVFIHFILQLKTGFAPSN